MTIELGQDTRYAGIIDSALTRTYKELRRDTLKTHNPFIMKIGSCALWMSDFSGGTSFLPKFLLC